MAIGAARAGAKGKTVAARNRTPCAWTLERRTRACHAEAGSTHSHGPETHLAESQAITTLAVISESTRGQIGQSNSIYYKPAAHSGSSATWGSPSVGLRRWGDCQVFVAGVTRRAFLLFTGERSVRMTAQSLNHRLLPLSPAPCFALSTPSCRRFPVPYSLFPVF